MNILDRIIAESVEYATGTGISPTRVYLGEFEIKELLFWAEQNCTQHKKNIEGKRPHVGGMEVFVVDAENHLACGG